MRIKKEIDLAPSGLSLKFDCRTRKMIFPECLTPTHPDVRRLVDARSFFLNPDAASPKELYYIYRGVMRREDEGLFRRLGLRFDITVIFPGQVGDEFVRTIGHEHPLAPTSSFGLTYPEAYEVLAGEAIYLMQKTAGEGIVEDVVAIKARPGEKVLIPPGYGHVTINTTGDILVISNLVESLFTSVYGRFEEQGPAYYALLGEENFLRNPRYAKLPPLRFLGTREFPEMGIVKSTPLYLSFIRAPERFRYLANPDRGICLWGEVVAPPH